MALQTAEGPKEADGVGHYGDGPGDGICHIDGAGMVEFRKREYGSDPNDSQTAGTHKADNGGHNRIAKTPDGGAENLHDAA